jgi:hypothetical protein
VTLSFELPGVRFRKTVLAGAPRGRRMLAYRIARLTPIGIVSSSAILRKSGERIKEQETYFVWLVLKTER